MWKLCRNLLKASSFIAIFISQAVNPLFYSQVEDYLKVQSKKFKYLVSDQLTEPDYNFMPKLFQVTVRLYWDENPI